MTPPDRDDRLLAALIDEITVDAHGDDEKFFAFRQAFEDIIAVPGDAFVIGEPVSVIAFEYDGNERRGVTARCRRADGAEHVVAVCEVVLPQNADGGRYLAAYRRWLGLAPYPSESGASKRPRRQHKVTATDLDLSGPIELVTLSVNYCSCPDFATNSLGTCKHVQFVLRKLEARPRTRARLRRGFQPPYSEIVLQYGARRNVLLRPGTSWPRTLAALAVKYFDSQRLLRADAYATFESFLS